MSRCMATLTLALALAYSTHDEQVRGHPNPSPNPNLWCMVTLTLALALANSTHDEQVHGHSLRRIPYHIAQELAVRDELAWWGLTNLLTCLGRSGAAARWWVQASCDPLATPQVPARVR
eukprot:scaffold13524_cov53-Phaeocystis_antarctica.AAC.1